MKNTATAADQNDVDKRAAGRDIDGVGADGADGEEFTGERFKGEQRIGSEGNVDIGEDSRVSEHQ